MVALALDTGREHGPCPNKHIVNGGLHRATSRCPAEVYHFVTVSGHKTSALTFCTLLVFMALRHVTQVVAGLLMGIKLQLVAGHQHRQIPR